MMVIGIVGTGLGGVLAPVGPVLFWAAEKTCACVDTESSAYGVCHCGDGPLKAAAVATIIGTVALVGVGIPLIVVGARRSKPDQPPSQSSVSAGATVVVGPTSGALQLRF